MWSPWPPSSSTPLLGADLSLRALEPCAHRGSRCARGRGSRRAPKRGDEDVEIGDVPIMTWMDFVHGSFYWFRSQLCEVLVVVEICGEELKVETSS